MPAPALATLAARSSKSLKDAERYWKEAKAAAQHRGMTKDDPNFWAYVMGIVKRRLGLAEQHIVLGDDLLIYLEDEEWQEHCLLESKKSLARLRLNPRMNLHAPVIEKKRQQITSDKVVDKLKVNYVNELSRIFTMTKPNERSAYKRILEHYRRAYIQGRLMSGSFDTKAKLTRNEEKYLETAAVEEARYFMWFYREDRDGKSNAPREKRIRRFMESIDSMYGSGRVAGLPSDSLLYWVGPNDEAKCPSCEYLVENSPYTRKTLPTLPRSNQTICLFNCRDQIVARRGSVEEVTAVEEKKSRKTHLRILERIKKTRKRSL